MSTAAIIARFQTPFLHEGHKALIDQVRVQHRKLIVVLGVSPIPGSRRNPYDYHTRERLIKGEYPEAVVLPLHDHPSDHVWSQKLDAILGETFPSETFTLYGSRDSFINYYHGRNETVELPQHGEYNATQLREQYADKVGNSQEFREGILYANYRQYPKVYPTVDVCVFSADKTKVLLGRKPGRKHWRFPGGFSDPTDASFEAAAKRELNEECGAINSKDWQYEGSFKIDDWRYKNEIDKIITTFFSCTYIGGKIEARDDINELQWFPIHEIPQLIERQEITPEHLPLFTQINQKYNTIINA